MSLQQRAQRFCDRTGRKRCVQLPEEALGWDNRECDLWFHTDGDFHPREVLAADWQGDATFCQPGRVSVVTVTTSDRQRFHELLLWNFHCQLWEDKELVVVETYEEQPSSFLAGKAAWSNGMKLISLPRLPGEDLSIGVKRNIGCHVARGEFIAHFDDDDMYSPGYLHTMVSRLDGLESTQAVKLSSWYVGNAKFGRFGFCDAIRLGRRRHLSRRSPEVQLGLFGFGFSLLYRRAVVLELPFPDEDLGEDVDWSLNVSERYGSRGILLIPDEQGICLHVQHGDNLADCDPFLFREVAIDEIKKLKVAQSPGFDSFIKLAELAIEVEEAKAADQDLPSHLAKAAAEAGLVLRHERPEEESEETIS
mmetsp:Transcript_48832/g.87939  ORF Transcript_48832/g.87939 Transcript_48832/m.87939 type:complete len:364 (-) Transcript_48832:42-1133(-)